MTVETFVGVTRSWVTAAVLALSAASLAGAQGIQVTADRTDVTIDDQILLVVRVEEAGDATPELPRLDGFRVTPAGQESQVSFVNGRTSSSVSYRFLLTPLRTGVFEVDSATLVVGDRTYASQPFEIRVGAASEKPQEARELFVDARVSTDSPYVGQQVLYTWRFFRRVQVADARLEPPEFEGFLVEELGDVREYQATVRGQRYLVNEIRRALFPQEVGKLTITPSELTVQAVVASRSGRARSVFDVFASPDTERRVLRGPTIELEVLPLPPEPAGFSGLVGKFDLAAEMTRKELKVGESSTLRLTIKGKGNAGMIGEPPLPPLPQFKIYDDKPKSSINRDGNELSGSKSFSKALVPLEAGSLTIPEIELSYFDPELGNYKIARTVPIELIVGPADGEEDLGLTESLAPTAGKVSVRIMADDILPLYKGLEAARGRSWVERPMFVVTGLMMPPVLFVAAVARQRRRRRFAEDGSLRRRQLALKVATEKLRALSGDGPRETADLGSRCLREFIGDMLGREGSALTPIEVTECLEAKALDRDLIDETTALLRRLESAQYGGASVPPAQTKAKLEKLLGRLNRELKG